MGEPWRTLAVTQCVLRAKNWCEHSVGKYSVCNQPPCSRSEEPHWAVKPHLPLNPGETSDDGSQMHSFDSTSPLCWMPGNGIQQETCRKSHLIKFVNVGVPNTVCLQGSESGNDVSSWFQFKSLHTQDLPSIMNLILSFVPCRHYRLGEFGSSTTHRLYILAVVAKCFLCSLLMLVGFFCNTLRL